MIHQHFSYIDWVVVIAYFAIVLLIGFVYRAGREGIFDYFFARGQMTWWAVGVSLIATSVSASTFLGNPAEAYQFDLRLLQLNLGVPVSILIVCWIFIPYFQKSGATSAYEVLEKRFDLKTRTLASSFYIIHVLLRTGILIYGPSIMVSQVSGVDIKTVIIVVGAVTIAYTALGGIRAVIWTDVMQFFILFVGAILICVFIDLDVPGGAGAIFAKAAAAGKLKIFDFSWDLADPRNIWGAGLAYITIDMAIRAADQQFVQRYLSCLDIRRARYAAILSAVIGLVIAVLFFSVGIFLWGFYQAYPGELLGITNVNDVLPHYVATKLTWGVSGLIVAAVFAAAMSSISSAINALSETATIDFYKRFGGSPEKEIHFARGISLLWGVIGIAMALYAATFGQNLFVLALSFTSLFTGALLGIFILAVCVKRASGWGAFTGALAGMAVLSIVTKVLDWPISWPWYPVISMTTTVAVGWLVSVVILRVAKDLMKTIDMKTILIISLLLIASCAKDLVTGKTTLNYYDIKKEPQIGSYVLLTQTKEFKGKGKKMDAEADKAEYERIKRIVARIAAVSHYPNFPYEAHLAEVDVVNAWCAPGGKIMVYTGLWDPQKGLVKKGDDDQLAAVLAHEIAHATARHVTESNSRNVTIAMAGAAAQTAIAAGGSSFGADLFGQFFSNGMNLYVPSYSRKNEYEADKLGLYYMADAGYDPRAAVELWKKAATKKKDKTSIYASHPASGDRTKALEKLLPEAIERYDKAKEKK